MAVKKALITGITGQDGSYLAEFLLQKGYEVHGTIRRASQFNTGRIDHLYCEPWTEGCRLFLHRADMTDHASLRSVVQKVMPDEIYNLAGQSHVAVSFEQPHYTYESIANGTLALLEAVREICPGARFYQASSSEMFGNAPAPQSINTPFRPCSPYGCAKVAAHFQAINHREAYGLFVCCGILFNHESPRRGETFVTRKITRAAARIKLGVQHELRLGNIEAKRDWGFAGDYVRAMWAMLQQPLPRDYVVAYGESHTVREFLHAAFRRLGLFYPNHLVIDERNTRRVDIGDLRGSSHARTELNWQPDVGFLDLVEMMVDADLELAKREQYILRGHLS